MNCKHCNLVLYENVTKIKRKLFRIWVHFATNNYSCLILAKTESRFMRKDPKKITPCINCGGELALVEEPGYSSMHRYWAHLNTGVKRDQKCPYVATPNVGPGS